MTVSSLKPLFEWYCFMQGLKLVPDSITVILCNNNYICIEVWIGISYRKAPNSVVQCSVFLQTGNIVDPPFTKCMDKSLLVNKIYLYDNRIIVTF